ncbi:MAG: antirepressor protein KilAC domain [Namikivirus ikeda]|uniref:Antirepressor protein KilAC domain n=1 Tax=Bacteriophage sp. TaxID=38018 RepID=A0ABY5TS11_9VIRU|nr:MAG: antirepressor protein KilAC domain [Bacteriophage sp.]
MNTEIQTFNFNNNPVRTLTDENGDPWFVAKDVCDILGHSNVSMALDRLDDDERAKFNLGRQGETNIVNEAGLYALVLGSRKPEAREFKRWVTHEVLPTIRKTGGYIPTAEADSDEDILARAVLIAQKTIDLKNRQLKAKDAQIRELEPKAKALEDFTNVPETLLVRDAAKLLSNAGTPIGEKELREWLNRHGWTYRHAGTWWATSERVKAGHLAMIESRSHGQHKDGSIFAFAPTVKITRKGLVLIHKRLGETLLNKALETTTH